VSGMMIPPLDFDSCSTRRTTTLSCNGLNDMNGSFGNRCVVNRFGEQLLAL
jgi:hypothetical protein